MRPVMLDDISAAARVLLALPEPRRAMAMRALIARAEAADRSRRTGGVAGQGNGSLMSAALTLPQAAPATPGAPDYLACLALAIEEILAHLAPGRRTEH